MYKINGDYKKYQKNYLQYQKYNIKASKLNLCVRYSNQKPKKLDCPTNCHSFDFSYSQRQ